MAVALCDKCGNKAEPGSALCNTHAWELTLADEREHEE